MHYRILTRACHSHYPLQSRTLATESALDLHERACPDLQKYSPMTEFACTAKAIKIKKTYGTTEVYSLTRRIDTANH